MKFGSRQAGVTLWGMFAIAFLVVIFALLLFKLIPPYLDDLKINTALKSLERQAQGSAMNKRDILIALEKRFDIDNVTHVNLREDVIIEKRGQFYFVRIDYEAQVPLLFNISALMEFDHSAEVLSGE